MTSNNEDSRPVIDLSDAIRPAFDAGQGVIVMQRDMPDAALLLAIKTAASFGKPFMVVPPKMKNLPVGAECTEAELEASAKRGAEDAAADIARGRKLHLMDECTMNPLENAYAMGWNLQYGTEENQRLWEAFREARSQGFAPVR